MSYILDALRKSDQERQQGQGPNLQTIHGYHYTGQAVSNKRWLFIGTLVAINLLAVGLWFYWPQTVGKSKAPPVANTIEQASESKAVVPALENTVDAPEQVIEATAASNLGSNYNQQSSGVVVEFADLPDPIQDTIPSLTFSFHVYSDNPKRRTIIINNRRVREGDSVSSGLTLLEITTDGVVLQWRGHRFHIAVLEAW